MIEDIIEYYEELTELEDEITEDAPAPIVCKSCGGGKWRSGRKDEAQLARRNEIMCEVREMFTERKTEQEVREHFKDERNRYINIDRYVRMFFRRHAREKK